MMLLQQVATSQSEQMCLQVGSDQLVPTFTKNDFKWLGVLGQYLTEKFEKKTSM